MKTFDRPYESLSLEELEEREKIRVKAANSLGLMRIQLRGIKETFSEELHECECCNISHWVLEPEARIHRSIRALMKKVKKIEDWVMDDHVRLREEYRYRS